MTVVEYEMGMVIPITVASGKTATAGYLCELTGDMTGRDNETKPADKVIGVFLKSGSAGDVVPVCTHGVFTFTAAAAGITAGKTVISGDGTNEEQKLEDGTTAGKVLGRALETASSGATAKVLIRP